MRLAAYAGAVLFAVTASAVLFRIVSVEYLRYPMTGWFSGLAKRVRLLRTLIFLDRDQRANGLLLVAFGILWHSVVGPLGQAW